VPVSGIEQLQAEARAEGYNFIDRLVEEWARRRIRLRCFRRDTVRPYWMEIFLWRWCGLNRRPTVLQAVRRCRIRRVYVRPDGEAGNRENAA